MQKIKKTKKMKKKNNRSKNTALIQQYKSV